MRPLCFILSFLIRLPAYPNVRTEPQRYRPQQRKKKHPLKGTFEGGGSDPARPYRYIKSKKHKNRRQKQVSTFQIIASVVKYDLHRLFAISQGEALGAGLRVGFKRGVQGGASRLKGGLKGGFKGGLRGGLKGGLRGA